MLFQTTLVCTKLQHPSICLLQVYLQLNVDMYNDTYLFFVFFTIVKNGSVVFRVSFCVSIVALAVAAIYYYSVLFGV